MKQNKREEVRGLFNRIAARYDIMNRIMTLGIDRSWRRFLVRAVPPEAKKVLDIATGTGDVAIAVAASHRNAAVTGIDNAESMLALAQMKTASRGITAVSFVRAPAENLPFPNRKFDTAVVAFGIRNCADNGVVLAETARVLSPGGVFAVLEFFRPDNIIPRIVQGLYLRIAVPIIARMFARGAVAEYRYLSDSIASYLSTDEFRALAAQNGFIHVRTKRFLFGVADCIIFERTNEKNIRKRKGKGAYR